MTDHVDLIARRIAALGNSAADDDPRKVALKVGKLAEALAAARMSFLDLSRVLRDGFRPDIVRSFDDWQAMAHYCSTRLDRIEPRNHGIVQSMTTMAENGYQPTFAQLKYLGEVGGIQKSNVTTAVTKVRDSVTDVTKVMGRPTIKDAPMSAAERKRRSRANNKQR
jgi:hypothetical protein